MLKQAIKTAIICIALGSHYPTAAMYDIMIYKETTDENLKDAIQKRENEIKKIPQKEQENTIQNIKKGATVEKDKDGNVHASIFNAYPQLCIWSETRVTKKTDGTFTIDSRDGIERSWGLNNPNPLKVAGLKEAIIAYEKTQLVEQEPTPTPSD